MSKHGKEHKAKASENRDLSWIRFNERVQQEADNPDNPLLERIKFLSIVSSNMDEFFQVRFHRLKDASEKEQLFKKVTRQLTKQANVQYMLYDSLRAELYQSGVQLFPAFSLTPSMIVRLRNLFNESILPYLKVFENDNEKIKQKQLYLCVKLAARQNRNHSFKLIPLPASVPKWFDIGRTKETSCFIRLEDIVKRFVGKVFPKATVEHSAVFRILRNQDFETFEKTVADVKPAVQEMLLKRPNGEIMRLEAETSMSEEMLVYLLNVLHVKRSIVYQAAGPIDLNKELMALYNLSNRGDLKFTPRLPKEIPELMGPDIFTKIDQKDRILFHPYHSFSPIIHLLEQAAEDTSVTAIYQTLYRVSGSSPIVANLAKAAENGKKVFVLFDAHARFDEDNNLYWGEKLERSGCIVQYGLPNMKVHSKITLIERMEKGQVHRELHLGTGNYHDGTAKLYTDFSLLTADPVLTQDAAEYFRIFDGNEVLLKELIKANDCLQPKLIELIEREKMNAENGKPAAIYAKMNSLCDKTIIKALFSASNSGVKIYLLVRGICVIIPGISGKSENIHVRSIVGRNLEHARIFIFENAGQKEIYLSSADWMPRNLYKRVELMFPIKDDACRNAVWNIFRLQWIDTEKCRHRRTDGSYVVHRVGADGVNSQEIMHQEIDAVMDGSCSKLMEIDAKEALMSLRNSSDIPTP